LLSGEFAPKTSIEVHKQNSIPVSYSREGQRVHGTLIVPDCPGEQWLGVYKKRHWSDEWEQLISKGCGCLLLLRADSDQIVAPYDWISYNKQFGSPINSHDSGNLTQQSSAQTPTQVIMVDWLQCLKKAFTARVSGQFRPRIGIVITAWDSIPSDQKLETPFKWLKSNFPMLAQFIECNDDQFNFEIFGVTIVGGDLKSDPAFLKQYKMGDPTKTGYVVFGSGDVVSNHSDLTLPVAWAMGLEKDKFPASTNNQ